MKSERSELRMEFAGRSPSFTRSKRMKSEQSELRMGLQDAVHVLQIGNPLYNPGIQTIKI